MLVLKEIGLYESIETDEQGRPLRGVPVTHLSRLATGNKIEAVLYLRIGGDPGSYPMTIQVQTPQPDYIVTFPATTIEIRPKGDCHLTIDIPLVNPPAGTFVLRANVGGQIFGEVEFDIGR